MTEDAQHDIVDQMTAHKHAELMAEFAEIAKTSATPWDKFEYLCTDTEPARWLQCNDRTIMFCERYEYRRKQDEYERWIPKRPTWCEVWNDGNEFRRERLIIGVAYPASNYADCTGGIWDHATPTTPPVWWPKEWV